MGKVESDLMRPVWLDIYEIAKPTDPFINLCILRIFKPRRRFDQRVDHFGGSDPPAAFTAITHVWPTQPHLKPPERSRLLISRTRWLGPLAEAIDFVLFCFIVEIL